MTFSRRAIRSTSEERTWRLPRTRRRSERTRQLRRAIHAEPEVGLQLPLTQQKILAALDGLPLEITLGSALTSVTAVLRGGGGGGPAVLLRADMDALPVAERTGLDFASRIDGTCTPAGMTCTRRCSSGRPAAVRAPGGAARQRGVHVPAGRGGARRRRVHDRGGGARPAGKRAAAAYALHVASAELPFGVFSSRPGPMMAAAEALDITVTGRGGHGSQPHHAADPIPAACEIVTALQVLVTRRFDIFDPVVITVGSFHAGTTNNVIPDEARLEVTIRSFSPRPGRWCGVGGPPGPRDRRGARAHRHRGVHRLLPGDRQRQRGGAVRRRRRG